MAHNTIRNEMERIQRVYDSEWKTIELTNGPITIDLTWKERIKVLFTGSLYWRMKFSCQIKGEVYITNTKVEYKRCGQY
jgi:hypothetical protein